MGGRLGEACAERDDFADELVAGDEAGRMSNVVRMSNLVDTSDAECSVG